MADPGGKSGSTTSASAAPPAGIVLRRIPTGPGALPRLLSELRKFHFTGLVEVRGAAGPPGSVMEINGVPVGARQGENSGGPALPAILKLGGETGGEMVVRGRIDIKAEVDRKPSARIRGEVSVGELKWDAAEIEDAVKRAAEPIRMSRPPATDQGSPVARTGGRSKESEAHEVRLMRLVAEGWSEAGFEVVELVRALDSSSPRARDLFARHETSVKRLREMDQRLAALESGVRGPEVAMLRGRLRDPARVDELETEVGRFLTKVEEERKLDRLRRQEEAGARQAAEYRRRERIRRVRDVYQLVLRAPARSGHPPGRKATRVTDARQIFDTFLITPRNREAYDACLAVSRRSRKHLLVVISGPRSTGKTHLLRSLQAQATAAGRITVGRVDCADPLDSLPAKEVESGLRALRRAHGNDAILLLDHLDHVAARDDLAIEVGNLVEDAMARGAHVVVACQQPSPSLGALPLRAADHLRTGVVVEAIPPGFDDRVEMLGRRGAALGYDLPKGLLAFIARAHSAEVGVEFASLEKLLAFAALLRRAPDLEFARGTVADNMMI
ncbi:MAG TPA: DnaA/Hda family protein [Thermoplasmata archaeon]|nr:DnaA/Hda family protein [Thermoplasmata archaeon]